MLGHQLLWKKFQLIFNGFSNRNGEDRALAEVIWDPKNVGFFTDQSFIYSLSKHMIQ